MNCGPECTSLLVWSQRFSCLFVRKHGSEFIFEKGEKMKRLKEFLVASFLILLICIPLATRPEKSAKGGGSRSDIAIAVKSAAAKDCGCGSCAAKGCNPCHGKNCYYCAAKALVASDCGCKTCDAKGCSSCGPGCDVCKFHLVPVAETKARAKTQK